MKLELLRFLRELVVPRLCPICQCKLGDKEKYLCLACAVELADFTASSYYPQERLYASFVFKELYSLFFYQKDCNVQKMIHSFKYRRHKDLLHYFCLKIEARGYFEQWRAEQYDMVVAIPTMSDKLRQRGYNQAMLVAEMIAEELDLYVTDSLIVRRKVEQSQTRLDKYHRYQNTKEAFVLNPQWSNAEYPCRVLLVDDVLTTGSTLSAVALLLEGLGVEQIDVFTLAVAI